MTIRMLVFGLIVKRYTPIIYIQVLPQVQEIEGFRLTGTALTLYIENVWNKCNSKITDYHCEYIQNQNVYNAGKFKMQQPEEEIVEQP